MREREQSAYRWARARAQILAGLLKDIAIKEDSVESSTWNRFSVALEAIDCAIASLEAVQEGLKAISASADNKEVAQLTLATAAQQHQHENKG